MKKFVYLFFLPLIIILLLTLSSQYANAHGRGRGPRHITGNDRVEIYFWYPPNTYVQSGYVMGGGCPICLGVRFQEYGYSFNSSWGMNGWQRSPYSNKNRNMSFKQKTFRKGARYEKRNNNRIRYCDTHGFGVRNKR